MLKNNLYIFVCFSAIYLQNTICFQLLYVKMSVIDYNKAIYHYEVSLHY